MMILSNFDDGLPYTCSGTVHVNCTLLISNLSIFGICIKNIKIKIYVGQSYLASVTPFTKDTCQDMVSKRKKWEQPKCSAVGEGTVRSMQ